MPYDRARRPGEDVVTFAIATERIAASSADSWRTMIAGGGVSEAFIEGLATPLLPIAAAAGPTTAKQAATTTAKVKAKLGLPASASRAEVLSAIDKLSKPAARRPAAAPVAAAASVPTGPTGPVVNAALNPAVFELATSNPQAFRDALEASGGSVPGLFGPGRDLPEVTASGISPSKLAEVPWRARPAIAAASDPEEAHELLALASGPDGDAAAASMPEFAGHPGVRGYLDDVRAFTEAGTAVMRRRAEDEQIAAARQQRNQIAASAGTEPSDADVYAAVFGGLEAHRARVDELRSRNGR